MKKSFFVMAAAATMFAMGLVSCGNKQNADNQEATNDTVVVAEPAYQRYVRRHIALRRLFGHQDRTRYRRRR